jgi:hypothetical protein
MSSPSTNMLPLLSTIQSHSLNYLIEEASCAQGRVHSDLLCSKALICLRNGLGNSSRHKANMRGPKTRIRATNLTQIRSCGSELLANLTFSALHLDCAAPVYYLPTPYHSFNKVPEDFLMHVRVPCSSPSVPSSHQRCDDCGN